MSTKPGQLRADEISSEQPFDVFVSSVMRDEVMPYREAARLSLAAIHGVRPWLFEAAPANAEPVVDGYLRRARDADAVVLLLAGETTAPVENEIAEALANHRPIWVFVLPEALAPSSQQFLKSLRSLGRFRHVTSPDDLSSAIERTLTDEMVRALRGVTNPTRRALLEQAHQESLARCVVRWKAIGVPAALAAELAEDIQVGAPDESCWPTETQRVVLLVGDLGSGKSLIAERLYQEETSNASSGSLRTPAWIAAPTAASEGVSSAVMRRSEGIGDPRLSGAFVVVDGLDEVDRAAADRIATEVQVLAETWPDTRIVLTSRPLREFHGIAESRTQLLKPEQALALASRFAGRAIALGECYHWPIDVQTAIQRPLFAILAGLFVRDRNNASPRSQGDLLSFLVEQALRVSREPTDAAYSALEDLARRVLDGQTEVPSAELRAARHLDALLASGLVTLGSKGYGFPLPVIGQWFGAHALLADNPTTAELAASRRLDRWRYPLFIAMTLAGADRVDSLLAPIARNDPGFASQLVRDGVPEWGLARDIPAPPALEAGARVSQSTQAWADGIGKLAYLLRVVRADGSLPTLGAATNAEDLWTAWYQGPDVREPVIPLPPEGHPFGVSQEWSGGRFARPAGNAGWNWRWSLEGITSRLEERLRAQALPTEDPTLIEEVHWAAACAVTHRGSLDFEPLDLVKLSGRIAEMRRGLGHERLVLFRAWRSPGHDIDALAAHVDEKIACGGTEWTLGRPYPDLTRPWQGNWIWSGYSTQQLVALVESVYRQAIPAYVDLAERWFSPFLARMRHYRLLPARISITVTPPDESARSVPSLSLLIAPLSSDSSTTFDTSVATVDTPSIWAAADAIRGRTGQLRPDAAEWLSPVASTSMISGYLNSNAVTTVVYEWLADDLKQLGWAP